MRHALDQRLIGFESLLRRIGMGMAMFLIPALMLARLTEILTRHLNTPGSLYNAMESELFMLFAFLTLAAAYAGDHHVRVDIFRARMRPRARAWLEIAGTVILILPFALIVLWYGSILTGIVLEDGERSAIALGAPVRFLIVGSLPVGIAMFTAVALSRMTRCILFLRGTAADPLEPRT